MAAGYLNSVVVEVGLSRWAPLIARHRASTSSVPLRAESEEPICAADVVYSLNGLLSAGTSAPAILDPVADSLFEGMAPPVVGGSPGVFHLCAARLVLAPIPAAPEAPSRIDCALFEAQGCSL